MSSEEIFLVNLHIVYMLNAEDDFVQTFISNNFIEVYR